MKNMKKTLKQFLGAGVLTLALTLSGFLVTGCDTTGYGVASTETPHAAPAGDSGSDILRVGDAVTIIFTDLPVLLPPFEERINEDGMITLTYNQTFKASGKTRGDLEREIRARYVPGYYNNLTVTIKQAERFYYVGGEVRMPSRQIHSGEITVLKAIQSAGDFTDFANKRKVRLTRLGGQTTIVDCLAALENPGLDLPVYPGDKITVKRRLW